MSFGLKNTGAMCKHLVNKVFEQLIGRNTEVYVDDMIVKSKSNSKHLTDLQETLIVL